MCTNLTFPALCLCRVQMAVLVPTTLVMHNFWDYADSSPAHQIEFMNFLKVSSSADPRKQQLGWCVSCRMFTGAAAEGHRVVLWCCRCRWRENGHTREPLADTCA